MRAEWEWVLGVNLRGVAHGLRFSLPISSQRDTEGCVVNTASAAALVHGPGMGICSASKAEVVIDAIRHERFYILTHPWVKEALQLRTQNILGQRDPWEGAG
jgi:hypothetical protein